MRKTTQAAFQINLFGDMDGQMKKRTEEPKKMVMFPGAAFSPKEKEARERIRRRREGEGKPPATPEREPSLNQRPAFRERIIPAASEGIPPESSPVRPQRQPIAPHPEPAQGMGAADYLLIALICASGIAAAGMSIYHGYNYLLSVGKPSWVAMITAVVMVIFSSTIFSFPFRGNRFFGYALRGLGIATIGFSIFSTIATNYNQFSIREEKEAASMRMNEAKQVELEALHVQLAGLEKQIDDLKQEAAYWKNISWARRDAADAALQAAYAERSSLWQKIYATGEAAYQVAETKTIFTYLAGIFHIRKALLEFILFCIPAVFYDLLAALAVNAVFSGALSSRKRGKGKNDH
jgi:hypothetical protein